MSVMNRAERRRLQTAASIKQATHDLLLGYGYQTVTVRHITEQADIGVGTFYLHFKDKDDVIWTVFREQSVVNDAQVVMSLADVSHGEKEYRAFLALFRGGQQRLALVQSIFGRGGSRELYQKYLDLIAEVFFRNVSSDALRPGLDNIPAEFVAHYFAGALLNLVLWWAERPDQYTPEDMAAMLYEVFYRATPPQLD